MWSASHCAFNSTYQELKWMAATLRYSISAAFNSTYQELKSWVRGKLSKRVSPLIAPIRNWNQARAIPGIWWNPPLIAPYRNWPIGVAQGDVCRTLFFAGSRINSTSQELKSSSSFTTARRSTSFNSTYQELKFVYYETLSPSAVSFNSTYQELKLQCVISAERTRIPFNSTYQELKW